MGAAVRLRTDYSASELRQLAKRAEDADQARRLLSLAAVLDGMNRKDSAEIGAMDRQTLRDWAHRFNEKGPAGLINGKAPGPIPKLSAEQKQELKRIVEVPIPPGMAWCAGDASTSGASSRNALMSISTRCRSAVSSRNSALPMSARVRDIPSRTRKPSRLLKKLSNPGGGGDRRQGDSAGSADRDLVPG